ncbi:MAG: hypothetical protein HZB26_02970 [Candidatus Hydrogenedentes bacterium]|nr:hypothetical protein [Candidatus Hydrogenedentota bacterium]
MNRSTRALGAGSKFRCAVAMCFALALALNGAGADSTKPAPPDEKKAAKHKSGKSDEVHGVGPVLDFPLKQNLAGGTELKDEKGWKDSGFVGTGKIRVQDGTVFLDEGNDITGITWTGPLVRMNYEISLEAKRVAGEDFFCGLTFPYGKDPCSLIVGGWGGTCVGISSLDYEDAYNNDTARFMSFEKDRWYKIRLCATEKRIQAWIDDKDIVDVSTDGRTIGIRWEVDKSTPLGIATWRTGGAIRNIQLRTLTEVEIQSAAKAKKDAAAAKSSSEQKETK